MLKEIKSILLDNPESYHIFTNKKTKKMAFVTHYEYETGLIQPFLIDNLKKSF